jgi:hypothetical protein
VAALAAVILWFAGHNFLVPLIAGAAVLGFGQLAGRQYRDMAWAFIPRKRQDRRRPLPAPWELGAGLALAAVLAAVLLLVALRLDQPDVSGGVRAFTFGMSAMAGLLWGAATMLAAGAGVGVWKLVEARRTARPRDRAHGG